MTEKLTKEEYQSLLEYERYCYDTMNHPRVSPRIFSILLRAYPKEFISDEQNLKN